MRHIIKADGRRQWTVAMVNWKSLDYLSGQLRHFYELNDPARFNFHVFDATFPRTQCDQLRDMLEPYSNTHRNVSLSCWDRRLVGRAQHGSELDAIMSCADSEFFLSNDPDFLWAMGNNLGLLTDVLKTCSSVGAQHNLQQHLPAWCAAYRLKDIKHTSWKGRYAMLPGWKRIVVDGCDTGWEPSRATDGGQRLVFQPMSFLPPVLGPVSYCGDKLHCTSYGFGASLLGTHMFRGQYVVEPSWKPTPKEWSEGRRAYMDYYFGLASANRY